MLITSKDLTGFAMNSADGEVGRIGSLYFDDRDWKIKWCVADTGEWLKGKQILISPSSLNDFRADEYAFGVELTKSQVESGPSVDTLSTKKFDQQTQRELPLAADDVLTPEDRLELRSKLDGHLQSSEILEGYEVRLHNVEVGHVSTLLVETEGWKIDSLVIETKGWWHGKKVLIPMGALEGLDEKEKVVFANLEIPAFQNLPEYNDKNSR